MPEIRYMCLSDLHLGEEDALLTDFVGRKERPKATKVLQELAKCLKFTLQDCGPKSPQERATLVLNGDILEFALSTTNQAAMAFQLFVSHLMPEAEASAFGKIILIPGNHDHHLWETARETQYVEHLSSLDPAPTKEFLEEPWHATNVFVEVEDEGVPTYFLQRLVRRFGHLKEMEVRTAYPNFGIANANLNKCVVFHHGHFIESLYHLMSDLKKAIMPDQPEAQDIWTIEEENFSWIDFFWSTMGSAGEVGTDIERIYESFQNPDQVAGYIVSFMKSMFPDHEFPKIAGIINPEEGLKWVVARLAERIIDRERRNDAHLLSPDALAGLDSYMLPLIRQIENEIEKRPNVGLKPGYDLTLVLGHTHKPFSWKKGSSERPAKLKTQQPLYNTGGWIVETTEPAAKHGAAVVLVDENLSTACIRLYNEIDDHTQFEVRVESCDDPSPDSIAFKEGIDQSVNRHSAEWDAFAREVVETVRNRREDLIAKSTAKTD